MFGFRTKLLQNPLCFFIQSFESVTAFLGQVFTDQPSLSIPGTTFTMSGNPFDSSRISYIVRSKRCNLVLITDHNSIEISSSFFTRLGSVFPFWLCQSSLTRRHILPLLLSFYDIFFGSLGLSLGGHRKSC